MGPSLSGILLGVLLSGIMGPLYLVCCEGLIFLGKAVAINHHAGNIPGDVKMWDGALYVILFLLFYFIFIRCCW